jgi:hypothetical protein
LLDEHHEDPQDESFCHLLSVILSVICCLLSKPLVTRHGIFSSENFQSHAVTKIGTD